MTRASIAAIASGTIIAFLAVEVGERGQPVIERAPLRASVTTRTTSAVDPGFLYGRVTVAGGTIYQGRLRFGGDEEAMWSNYFNGFKGKNPWIAYVPKQKNLGRPFMTRFGDILRLDADGRDLMVTLKSGRVVHLNRYAADDYADGVRVWDDRRGVVDLHERKIHSIEFLAADQPATPASGDAPLYGTVHTKHGSFTGFIQWNRKECLSSDQLDGKGPDGETRLPFATIRSIARRSHASSVVTLRDGRELLLSGTREVGEGNAGIYVDDPRYGRVLVSWDAFERADFAPASATPTYADYAPGRALLGSVVTRSGRRLVGRLVFDLDESETTETLDAASRGVNYTIPFALIASLELSGDAPAVVKLHSGEALAFEPNGDLHASNAGMLVFLDGQPRPVYVPWTDIAQVRFDRH